MENLKTERVEEKESIPSKLCRDCEHNTWKNQTWCNFHKFTQAELIYCGFKGYKIIKEINYIEGKQFYKLNKTDHLEGVLNGYRFLVITKHDKDLSIIKYDAIDKTNISLTLNIKSVLIEMRKSKDNSDYFVTLYFYTSTTVKPFKMVLRC